MSSRRKMCGFIPGLFTSKLMYGLPLISSVWSIAGYADKEPQKHSFKKKDILKLQALQNQAALLLQPLGGTQLRLSTASLLSSNNWLSVHQLTVYTTLLQLVKTLQHGTPSILIPLQHGQLQDQCQDRDNHHQCPKVFTQCRAGELCEPVTTSIQYAA